MTFRYRSIALILMLLVALPALAACSRDEEPTPEPVPTREVAQPETETEPEYDSAWARVEAEGLVVGTSADYPPFESYDESFEIVGFDIALAQAIAAQLGVEMEVKDFAFDGLYNALTLDQADVAIAAISATPEREEVVDFSFIYFVSEDAFVAAEEAEIGEITDVTDLALYTVGVQRGSVFQDWLEDELVDTGLMEETNLFVYGDVDEGMVDLAEGRVDLLVMDLQPAKAVVEAEPAEGEEAEQAVAFKIAAQGLNRENYAIAVKKGENELRSRINQALLVLKDDGTIARLALEYLALEAGEMLPVPEPGPEAEATTEPAPPPATCIDGLAWVSDLTLDDQNMTNPPRMYPGQPFQKGWRVRNTGTCTWDSSYTLQFAYGNQSGTRMNGQTVYVQGSVAPGQTYDFYVDMVAPLRAGVYHSVWQAHNSQNLPFGERVYVGIEVVAAATPTPVTTATPAPDINFWADSTSINEGDCTTIRWDVENISSVYFYEEGQDWRKHGVTGQGSQQVCPSETTTYVLRVVHTDETVNEYQITVSVNQNQQAPDVKLFDVEPSGQIATGQCVNVRWDVGGAVDNVDVTRNGDTIWGDAPFRGSIQDCPPGPGDYTYMLDATGPGGGSRATDRVRVVAGAPTATPAPTGVPEPAIDSFSVEPGQLNAGGCVKIAWSTSAGTSSTRILRDGAVMQDEAGLSGRLSDCLSDPGTYAYRLEAYNRAGAMVSSDTSVTVVGGTEPTAAPPTEAPEPTAVPDAVEVTSFSSAPGQIDASNACVTLTWTIEGSGLALVRLFRNGELVASDPESGYQDCPDASLAGTTIAYTLQADSEHGSGDSAELSVDYVAPAPLPGDANP